MSLAPACGQLNADASRSRMLAAGWSRPSIAFRRAWPAASSSGVHQCAPSNSSAVHGSGRASAGTARTGISWATSESR